MDGSCTLVLVVAVAGKTLAQEQATFVLRKRRRVFVHSSFADDDDGGGGGVAAADAAAVCLSMACSNHLKMA
jgi:hypothetical protein